jgi:hypothetical protein
MRTNAVLGGATASAGFDQLQLTQSSSKSRSKQGNHRGTTDMMRRMMVPLAGHPGGSSVCAPCGGELSPRPWWPGQKGW